MTDGDSSRRSRPDGLRVLVVEDEFLVALTIEAALADLRCDVIGPASRLPDAFRLAHEETLDGAILDVNIDGRKIDPVARELRRRGVPIIVITGYDEASIGEDLRSAPRLHKPFEIERLRRLATDVFIKS